VTDLLPEFIAGIFPVFAAVAPKGRVLVFALAGVTRDPTLPSGAAHGGNYFRQCWRSSSP